MPKSVYAQGWAAVFCSCKNGITTIHGGRITRWQGRDRDVTYKNNAGSNCRMPKSVYAQGWAV
jgi:hypothetical protein